MSKVSIERVELIELQIKVAAIMPKELAQSPECVKDERQWWNEAMCMLNAMIGKGEEGDAGLPPGYDFKNPLAPTPPAPESVCHRRECQRWDHCARNTDGPCAIYVRPPWVGSAPDAGKLADSISFQMTASLEAEVKDAVKALAKEVVAEALKAHEAERHPRQGRRKGAECDTCLGRLVSDGGAIVCDMRCEAAQS